MALAIRILRALPMLILAPFLMAISAAALAATDLVWKISGRRTARPRSKADNRSASVVIPNWNGRDLLERYLPSVIEALSGNPANEVIVVDNGSSDGSADSVRQAFPSVRVLALPENLGFGGGSNAGFREARNDVVVLLNSDMRVAPDFLAPLLEGFDDPEVFAVSCQIFFSDPNKLREETGLTQAWWRDGGLRVRHRDDPAITGLYPCFYGGGGSCAFDRRKFLELGGFDELLKPFYLEDTDLGFLAWKRGWKVYYQPRSIVYHEHRGTIGKKFTYEYIQAVLKKNFILFCWKNIHEWRRLGPHFFFTWAGSMLAVLFGEVVGRPNFAAVWRAFAQLPGAVGSRWRARSLAVVSDTEAFRRPLGGYFRDRFLPMERAPERPRVLFVSPYPILPPVHGGGVFMYQTLIQMARLTEVHVVELLDWDWQVKENAGLRQFCASAEWLVRPAGEVSSAGALRPHAVEEFANSDLEWLIHRQMFLKQIDVLQLEYTPLAQYRGDFRRIPCALFEHDVYFQSIARGLQYAPGVMDGMNARVEYLRALRWELRALPGFDQVQVCTPANGEYLLSFLPDLAPRLRAGLRAGIDTSSYEFRPDGREPLTMLFVGSFRHDPNRIAMDWFVNEVMPMLLARQPQARLVVAGSDPPPAHAYSDFSGALEMLGYVDDVRQPLGKYAVFICPILSGSGVRVKLLEAFAAGIPVVSTRVGAEGLARNDGEFCRLADDPAGFADRIAALLDDPKAASEMARRARAEVEANWDMAAITGKLVDGYREMIRMKRVAEATSSSAVPYPSSAD
jgi:GT2 family glycosyltransferase/glycosyltransferase involved in cell wall biosynthesis